MRRAALLLPLFLAACAARKPFHPPTLSSLPLPTEAKGSFEIRIVGGSMAGIRTHRGGTARFPAGDESPPKEIRLNEDRLRVDADGWYLNGERVAARRGSFLIRGAQGVPTLVTPVARALPLPVEVTGTFELRIAEGALVALDLGEDATAVYPETGDPTEIRLNEDRLRVGANGWHLNGMHLTARDGTFVARGKPVAIDTLANQNMYMLFWPGVIYVSLVRKRTWEPTAIELIDRGQSPPYPIPGYRPGVHGKGSLHLDDGIPYLTLRGTPEEMGEQAGTLLRNQIRYLIRWYFLPLLGRHRWEAIKIARTLKGRTPKRYVDEMHAAAYAADVGFDDMLIGNMMVEIYQTKMCSALALRGDLTEGGRLLVGRNVDFPPHAILQHLTVIVDRQGTDGKRFVSIGWPGAVGVVSGMNVDGLCAANLVAEYEERSLGGIPYAILLRMLLEETGNVEEALKLLESKRRTTGNSILLADAGGEAAVAEVTFWKFKARRMENDRLFATNLFRSDPDYPYPCGRYDRMVELVDAAEGPLSTDDVTRILDEVDIPWNSVQSMIFLPESKRILLSAGRLPAASGPFLPLGLWD